MCANTTRSICIPFPEMIDGAKCPHTRALPGLALLLVYALHNGDKPKAMNANKCVWCKKIFSNYHIYKTSHMPYRHLFLHWINLWNVTWLLFRWITFIFTKHGKVKYHVIPRHCICIVSHITYHISHQSLGTSFYLVLWLVNKQIVHMFITLRQRKMGAILLTIFSN